VAQLLVRRNQLLQHEVLQPSVVALLLEVHAAKVVARHSHITNTPNMSLFSTNARTNDTLPAAMAIGYQHERIRINARKYHNKSVPPHHAPRS
jgi:hypothetical protein